MIVGQLLRGDLEIPGQLDQLRVDALDLCPLLEVPAAMAETIRGKIEVLELQEVHQRGVHPLEPPRVVGGLPRPPPPWRVTGGVVEGTVVAGIPPEAGTVVAGLAPLLGTVVVDPDVEEAGGVGGA